MNHKLICGDALEILPKLRWADCLIADPPDNIGLKYNSYNDCLPEEEYENFLWNLLNECVQKAGVIWISYNAKWTFMMGSLVQQLLRNHPFEAKQFVQTFTFGQNCKTDCGNGHRPLLRLRQQAAPLYPQAIKVPSWRELNGDKRAAKGGRVPLDHWDIPRVTGNSKQRRPWHRTQLNEKLVERCIIMSTKEGGTVLDVFSGTGTAIRVCKRINRKTVSLESDPFYCEKIAEEHNIPILEGTAT